MRQRLGTQGSYADALYNARPQWLADVHAALDAAAAAAYGWNDGITDDKTLRDLRDVKLRGQIEVRRRLKTRRQSVPP